MPIILLLICFVICLVLVRRWMNRRAQKVVLTQWLTAEQRRIIAEQAPLTQKLPAQLRNAFEGKVNLFLRQVEFHGCNGLEVTDEMRLAIAAQACLLVVNRDVWYDNLRTVLLYPGAFKSRWATRDDFVVTEAEVVRLGESWHLGPVVLSWPDVDRGSQDLKDGLNVVLHEFAHQFDSLSGQVDGVPVLVAGHKFAAWERVFVDAYQRHVEAVEKGRKTVIREYGAENTKEFFAVSVEAFFEKPKALKREVPEVYEQLAELFWLDPATWS